MELETVLREWLKQGESEGLGMVNNSGVVALAPVTVCSWRDYTERGALLRAGQELVGRHELKSKEFSSFIFNSFSFIAQRVHVVNRPELMSVSGNK